MIAALAVAAVLAGPGEALECRTDARIDLVGLVQQLAGDNAFTARGGPPGGYGLEGLRRFSAQRRHPAVARLRGLLRSGFGGSVPAQYALYLSSPPLLQESLPVPDFFADSAGGREALEGFRSALASFWRDTGFEAWYASQAQARLQLEAELRRSLSGADLEGELVAYLGFRPWESLTAYASPFFPSGRGSFWVVEPSQGLPRVYATIGPDWAPGQLPFAPLPEVASTVWREAVFSAAYMITELCRTKLAPSRELCRGQRGLDSPEDCLQGLWVEGVVTRLRGRLFGAQGDSPRLRRIRSPFVEPVLEALRAYESSRDRYRTLIAFTPGLARSVGAGAGADACPELDRADGGDAYRRWLSYYRRSVGEGGGR